MRPVCGDEWFAVFHSLKVELVHQQKWATGEAAKRDLLQIYREPRRITPAPQGRFSSA